jgi:hypothetical protein
MRLPRLTTRRLMALVAAVAASLGLCEGFARLAPGQQDILGGTLLLLALPLSPMLAFLLVRLLADPSPSK